MLTTPWPVNPGAYLRSFPAALTVLAAVLARGTYDVTSAAALVVALAGDLAVLISPRFKSAITWAGTLAATFLLALAQTEGNGGDMQLGQLWVQVDAQDLLVAAALVAKSVLTTVLPNATARYTVPGEVLDEREDDVVAPEQADPSGDVIGHVDRLSTEVLTALSPQQVAAHAAARVPAPAAPVDDVAVAEAGDGPSDGPEHAAEPTSLLERMGLAR